MPITRETPCEADILDEFALVMGHEYRRQVLFKLHGRDGKPVEIPEDIYIRNRDADGLYIDLCHNHLPKLDSAGLIEWNREQQIVRTGEQFDSIEPLLEVLRMYYDYIVPYSNDGQKA